MPKSPETAIDIASEHDDENYSTIVPQWDKSELRKQCSLLVSTPNPNIKIGVTFGTPHMDVSFVRIDFRGTNRAPFHTFYEDYELLRQYAEIGIVCKRFAEDQITWGDFKREIQLAGEPQ